MALRMASMPMAGSLAWCAGRNWSDSLEGQVRFKTSASPVFRHGKGGRNWSDSHEGQLVRFKTSASPVFRQGKSSRLVAVRAATVNDAVPCIPLPKPCRSAIYEVIRALSGLAKYFLDLTERKEVPRDKLTKYLIESDKGLGEWALPSLSFPPVDFKRSRRDNVFYAMDLALYLETATMEKLYSLHKVAEDANYGHLTDYIESELLPEQMKAIKKGSELVSQVRMFGSDALVHWDQILLEVILEVEERRS